MLNTQRKTPQILWSGDGRIKEEPSSYPALEKDISTPNAAQRSTSNVQLKNEPRFDLEERLLEFSARIIRVDALPKPRASK